MASGVRPHKPGARIELQAVKAGLIEVTRYRARSLELRKHHGMLRDALTLDPLWLGFSQFHDVGPDTTLVRTGATLYPNFFW